MEFLIENSSVAGALNCYKTEASEADVKELLQLCTALIFADRIVIPGFVHDSVRFQTREFIDLMKEFGSCFDSMENLFHVTPHDETKVDRAYSENIVSLEGILVDTGFHESMKTSRLEVPDAHKDYIEKMHSALGRKDAIEYFQSIHGTPVEEHGMGIAGKLLSLSPDVLKFAMDEYSAASHEKTYVLVNVCRFLANQSLSKSLDNCTYYPTVQRSLFAQYFRVKNLDKLGKFFVDKVSDEIMAEVLEKEEESVIVPTLTSAILKKSESSFDTLIKTCFELRERAQPVRELIDRLQANADGDAGMFSKEIDNEVSKIKMFLKDDDDKSSSHISIGNKYFNLRFPLFSRGFTIADAKDLKRALLRRKSATVLGEFCTPHFNPNRPEHQCFRELVISCGRSRA